MADNYDVDIFAYVLITVFMVLKPPAEEKTDFRANQSQG
jgi:hypothetical protein